MSASQLLLEPQAPPLPAAVSASSARPRGRRAWASLEGYTSATEMRRSARAILVITLLLMGLGQVMVFSATASRESYLGAGPNLHPLLKQALKVALALLAMIVMMRIDYRRLERWSLPILIATLVALLLVLIPGIGARLNAARRWIQFTPGVTLQPSDFARLALILYLASFFHRQQGRLQDFYRGFGPPAIATGAVAALTLAEPDFGTTITIGAVAVLLMLVAGTKTSHLLSIAFVTVPIILLYVSQSLDYVMKRFDAFLNPQHMSQVFHSVQSIATGGAFGVGLGAGTFKLHFVPETENDFIFSVIGEELGFFGSTLVILLYCGFIISGVRLLLGIKDRFGLLVGTGVLFTLTLPAVINIAVATASAPAKGLPLPFVSAGGTSMLVCAAGVGLLLSLARTREPQGSMRSAS